MTYKNISLSFEQVTIDKVESLTSMLRNRNKATTVRQAIDLYDFIARERMKRNQILIYDPIEKIYREIKAEKL